MFYWFFRSSKRKSILQEYNEFCDEEYVNIVQHISTRWLCLKSCVSRELDKFEGIKSYFLSERSPDKRFKRLRPQFEDPMTTAYLRFYQSTLPVFDNMNKLLQAEDPLIHRQYETQQHFMKKLASKFIEPEVIQRHVASGGSLGCLDLSTSNQKSDADLSVGLLTGSIVEHLFTEGDVSQQQVDRFYDGVRAFFTKAYSYCASWLRLDDDLLRYCVFVDFTKRAATPFSYVEKILPFFKNIYDTTLKDPAVLEGVHDEYIEYQAISDTDIISDEVWERAQVGISDNENDNKRKCDYRMDVIWGHLQDRFPDLAAIALTVLTVPHSNAAEERAFSIIRRNRTDFRPTLQLGVSLNSIMRIKMAMPESLCKCCDWEPAEELLRKCKSATREYNKQHGCKK